MISRKLTPSYIQNSWGSPGNLPCRFF